MSSKLLVLVGAVAVIISIGGYFFLSSNQSKSIMINISTQAETSKQAVNDSIKKLMSF